MKRANKKQNKRDWFLKQRKKAPGTSTGASLIIQQQQEEIERLRHELQAKESRTKKKKKRRGLTYEELNSKKDNRTSIEFDEDKEIAYLEKKLMGNKGGNSQKLMKELLEEDGYENDFLNLLDTSKKLIHGIHQEAEESKMTEEYRFQEDVSSSSDASSATRIVLVTKKFHIAMLFVMMEGAQK